MYAEMIFYLTRNKKKNRTDDACGSIRHNLISTKDAKMSDTVRFSPRSGEYSVLFQAFHRGWCNFTFQWLLPLGCNKNIFILIHVRRGSKNPAKANITQQGFDGSSRQSASTASNPIKLEGLGLPTSRCLPIFFSSAR